MQQLTENKTTQTKQFQPPKHKIVEM